MAQALSGDRAMSQTETADPQSESLSGQGSATHPTKPFSIGDDGYENCCDESTAIIPHIQVGFNRDLSWWKYRTIMMTRAFRNRRSE
jgi:hypothetical protein